MPGPHQMDLCMVFKDHLQKLKKEYKNSKKQTRQDLFSTQYGL